jgi:GTPase SAR1 family protein
MYDFQNNEHDCPGRTVREDKMSDSEEEAASERLFKIVLVGDSQAGKTAICQR